MAQETLLKLLGGHFSDVVVRKIKDGKVRNRSKKGLKMQIVFPNELDTGHYKTIK